MNRDFAQILEDFLSGGKNIRKGYRDDNDQANEENIPHILGQSGSNLFHDDIGKKLGKELEEKKNFFKYTEYSLSSLYMSDNQIPLEEDPQYETFINIITKASDANNEYKWVDDYFKCEVKEEVNILTPQSQDKDFVFRKYIQPNQLKNICLLRKYEQAAISKTPEKNKVDAKIVSEYIVHDSYRQIMKALDFKLSHRIFTQAHIFHSKYGNSDHIIILVMRHYRDENFLHPLFPDRAFVQIKSYVNDNKYSDMIQKNLLNYAEIFKPYIKLRKVDSHFVEQIKDRYYGAF
ncbi:conserved Plasmodium protein, unknown function [Plasmodium knowlesi strain H]|uniref:Mediator of RNA polymerase II transcription subunit 18, putative n=3 Tax=Plasmodium knowlesi TaxID=5850 RepID=B3LCC6_PLAKH|nr:mediator of RNA polymerase II transcription subunit 18, putative [Plasmodium knowlesi strain H]OTN64163.1 Uncharacterized protein PKNOH_S140250500 [Plasmodium knowlesi]CAA9990922.1 mediator of RNA polymerase II transcription subunit 18, putative [Plasmodium knowlesi strain H]SBO20856.1 conserved Plasmodium protein, unknown function [Plasmodium knowlesi strain H]VVS80396.1 mediator of RNA polymerase II transcription subunit 18, putative [Plasmodium knowlesi strain H]|eukprot:XP_002262207.1 hypothetical protein, conserved in Plasmodium species [Plasmodium knowlesi strain H]